PQRNEYMSAWSDAVLIIEGKIKSGTLITAHRATQTNKDDLVVSGSIFSEQSEGTHYLLNEGAIPIRTPKDILRVLGLEKDDTQNPKTKKLFKDESEFPDCTEHEVSILKILRSPSSRDDLYRASNQ